MYFTKEGMEWTNTKGSRDNKFMLQRHTQCILWRENTKGTEERGVAILYKEWIDFDFDFCGCDEDGIANAIITSVLCPTAMTITLYIAWTFTLLFWLLNKLYKLLTKLTAFLLAYTTIKIRCLPIIYKYGYDGQASFVYDMVWNV